MRSESWLAQTDLKGGSRLSACRRFHHFLEEAYIHANKTLLRMLVDEQDLQSHLRSVLASILAIPSELIPPPAARPHPQLAQVPLLPLPVVVDDALSRPVALRVLQGLACGLARQAPVAARAHATDVGRPGSRDLPRQRQGRHGVAEALRLSQHSCKPKRRHA